MGDACLHIVQVSVADVDVLNDFIHRVFLRVEPIFDALYLTLLLVENGFESVQVIPLLSIHRSHVGIHHLVVVHLDVIGRLGQHEAVVDFFVHFQCELLQMVLQHTVHYARRPLQDHFVAVLRLVLPHFD